MKKYLLALLLLSGSFPVISQPRLLYNGLYPHILNHLVIENSSPLSLDRVRIFGLKFDKEEIILFEAAGALHQRKIDCYFYLDQEIQSVRVELLPGQGLPTFELAVDLVPFRIAVYSPHYGLKPATDTYFMAGTLEELGAGDIFIYDRDADNGGAGGGVIERMRTKGIQVIASGGTPGGTESRQNAWRGSITWLESPSPGDLESILREKRNDFLQFKNRYFSLIAGLEFHGVSLTPVGKEAQFVQTEITLQDIAQTLENEVFGNRLSLAEILILAGFYIPCSVAIIVVKKTKVALPVLGGLLLLFMAAMAIYPQRDTVFKMEINPSRLAARPLRFERHERTASDTLSPSYREFLATESSLKREELRLTYEVVSSYRGISAAGLLGSELIKFNQYPLITLREGSYSIKHTNPLKMWYLHGPE